MPAIRPMRTNRRTRGSRPGSMRRTARAGMAAATTLTASAVLALSPLAAAGAQIPSAVAAVPASSAPKPFVSRMTVRWQPFTDTRGQVWQARSASLGTQRLSTALEGKDIIGTSEDGLYVANAAGVTGYRLAVPHAGTYKVRLLMAESWHNAAGKRVFDVEAEGKAAAESIDIFGAVGKGAAHDVLFRTEVADGTLDLRFIARADLPLISAIEVIDVTGQARPETFASRMTASRTSITDSKGKVWDRMGPGFGTSRRSVALVGKDIQGTEDDDVYRISGIDAKGMLVPVPGKADYTVRLLMADGAFSEAGERVFDIIAEGRSVARGVDIVARVGKGAAYDLTFPARVEDGMLTIQFVAKANLPLISAIEVTSTDPGAEGQPKDISLIPLPDTSVYHTSIKKAPVAPDSDVLMTRLREDIDGGAGYTAAVNSHQYNAAFHVADDDTPRYTVEFDDCQRKGYIPSHLFTDEKYFVDVPVPANAQAATGTDAQMTIYHPGTDQIWEFWKMKRTASGGWSACWGGRIDNLSSSNGIFPEPFGVAASGLLMVGGVIGIEEAAHGRIDHALYLTVKQANELISYPANRTDGKSKDPAHLREGQRLRLDPSLDIRSLNLTPLGEVIARAAQRYGFIVSDQGGAVGLATQSGRVDQERTGINPWNILLGGPSYTVMAGFPWDKVEALEVDYGKPSDG